MLPGSFNSAEDVAEITKILTENKPLLLTDKILSFLKDPNTNTRNTKGSITILLKKNPGLLNKDSLELIVKNSANAENITTAILKDTDTETYKVYSRVNALDMLLSLNPELGNNLEHLNSFITASDNYLELSIVIRELYDNPPATITQEDLDIIIYSRVYAETIKKYINNEKIDLDDPVYILALKEEPKINSSDRKNIKNILDILNNTDLKEILQAMENLGWITKEQNLAYKDPSISPKLKKNIENAIKRLKDNGLCSQNNMKIMFAMSPTQAALLGADQKNELGLQVSSEALPIALVGLDAICQFKEENEKLRTIQKIEASSHESSQSSTQLRRTESRYEELQKKHFPTFKDKDIPEIEKRIRLKLLDTILLQAKDSTEKDDPISITNNKEIVKFISSLSPSQREELATASDPNSILAKTARSLFTSNIVTSQATWRAYDVKAPVVTWDNLFDPKNEQSKVIKRFAAIAFLETEKLEKEKNTDCDLWFNFQAMVAQIRRAHNGAEVTVDRNDIDSPSCFLGTKGRLGNILNSHPLFKYDIEEDIKSKISALIARKLKEAFSKYEVSGSEEDHKKLQELFYGLSSFGDIAKINGILKSENKLIEQLTFYDIKYEDCLKARANFLSSIQPEIDSLEKDILEGEAAVKFFKRENINKNDQKGFFKSSVKGCLLTNIGYASTLSPEQIQILNREKITEKEKDKAPIISNIKNPFAAELHAAEDAISAGKQPSMLLRKPEQVARKKAQSSWFEQLTPVVLKYLGEESIKEKEILINNIVLEISGNIKMSDKSDEEKQKLLTSLNCSNELIIEAIKKLPGYDIDINKFESCLNGPGEKIDPQKEIITKILNDKKITPDQSIYDALIANPNLIDIIKNSPNNSAAKKLALTISLLYISDPKLIQNENNIIAISSSEHKKVLINSIFSLESTENGPKLINQEVFDFLVYLGPHAGSIANIIDEKKILLNEKEINNLKKTFDANPAYINTATFDLIKKSGSSNMLDILLHKLETLYNTDPSLVQNENNIIAITGSVNKKILMDAIYELEGTKILNQKTFDLLVNSGPYAEDIAKILSEQPVKNLSPQIVASLKAVLKNPEAVNMASIEAIINTKSNIIATTKPLSFSSSMKSLDHNDTRKKLDIEVNPAEKSPTNNEPTNPKKFRS